QFRFIEMSEPGCRIFALRAGEMVFGVTDRSLARLKVPGRSMTPRLVREDLRQRQLRRIVPRIGSGGVREAHQGERLVRTLEVQGLVRKLAQDVADQVDVVRFA